MYQNMEEIITDLEKWHTYGVSGCCSVSNFLIFCRKFAQAIESENKEEAVKELADMTLLYRYATSIQYKYYKDAISVDNISIEEIKRDFESARKEIEEYFCKNFITGDFEITEDILKRHWDMVDWDAYHNTTNRRFIDACKEANKIVGWKKDDEISATYWEDEQYDKRYKSMQEIFYSSYNGGRVRASFTDASDCILWGFHREANLESDGLYWAEQPAY